MNKPNMWRLYSLSALIEDILPNAINEDGEIIDDLLLEEINNLQNESTEIINSMVLYLKELEYRNSAMKEEIKNMKDRIIGNKNAYDSVSNVLKNILNGKKYEGENFEVKFTRSRSIEVVDMEIVPEQYIRTKTERSVDKVAVLSAMTNKEQPINVDGCMVREKLNMSIK